MIKSNLLRLLFFCVGVASGVILSLLCRKHFAPDTNVGSKADTTIVIDTNIYMNPLPVTVEININDNIIVPQSDIIITQDSLIVLPKSVKTYSDKSYKCQVSGYQPSLDWIEVYPETRYITKKIKEPRKPTRWGIGIQVGYGFGFPDGRIIGCPYVGFGISYNLIRF